MRLTKQNKQKYMQKINDIYSTYVNNNSFPKISLSKSEFEIKFIIENKEFQFSSNIHASAKSYTGLLHVYFFMFMKSGNQWINFTKASDTLLSVIEEFFILSKEFWYEMHEDSDNMALIFGYDAKMNSNIAAVLKKNSLITGKPEIVQELKNIVEDEYYDMILFASFVKEVGNFHITHFLSMKGTLQKFFKDHPLFVLKENISRFLFYHVVSILYLDEIASVILDVPTKTMHFKWGDPLKTLKSVQSIHLNELNDFSNSLNEQLETNKLKYLLNPPCNNLKVLINDIRPLLFSKRDYVSQNFDEAANSFSNWEELEVIFAEMRELLEEKDVDDFITEKELNKVIYKIVHDNVIFELTDFPISKDFMINIEILNSSNDFDGNTN